MGDSSSALTSISNLCPKNELVRHIQETLTTTNKQISIMWALLRVKISDNEILDLTTNEALTSQSFVKIYFNTIFETIDNLKKK